MVDGRLGLEVGEVLEREALLLAIQLLRAFFAAMDDRVDVVVDHQAVKMSDTQQDHEVQKRLTRQTS